MNGTMRYDKFPLKPLVWWRCEKRDPYDQWAQDTRVSVTLSSSSEKSKKKFRQYIARHKQRWGAYYDCLDDMESFPNFDLKKVRTVYKLYGPKRPTGGPDLTSELVRIFDHPKLRGGFYWVKRLQKKLGLKG